MVKAGEIGGALEQVLDRLAMFQEKAQAVRSKVKGAMWYPAVVITIAMSVVAIIMIFVVPKFAAMFEGLGAELPFLTQLLVDISNNMVNYWYVPLIAIAALIFGFTSLNKTSYGAYMIDRAKLKIPIFGNIVQKSAIARFARTFGTLLDTGVPILQTLLIVKDTSGNEVISRAMIDIHASIRDGDTVSEPMKNFPIFPPLVVHMIAVGEETGALDKMLIKVADAFEREVDDAVDGLAKLIEPLLICMLGGIIGTVVVALYLPIFSVTQVMSKG
jgi:type IV pilus assembly protein PilC